MIGELGQVALCFALALSLVLSASGLMGARAPALVARRVATSSALGLFVFVAWSIFVCGSIYFMLANFT